MNSNETCSRKQTSAINRVCQQHFPLLTSLPSQEIFCCARPVTDAGPEKVWFSYNQVYHHLRQRVWQSLRRLEWVFISLLKPATHIKRTNESKCGHGNLICSIKIFVSCLSIDKAFSKVLGAWVFTNPKFRQFDHNKIWTEAPLSEDILLG